MKWFVKGGGLLGPLFPPFLLMPRRTSSEFEVEDEENDNDLLVLLLLFEEQGLDDVSLEKMAWAAWRAWAVTWWAGWAWWDQLWLRARDSDN